MDEPDKLQYLPLRMIEAISILLLLVGISMWFTAPHVTMVTIEAAQKIAFMIIGMGGVIVVAIEIMIYLIKPRIKNMEVIKNDEMQ
jgi:nitrate reductase gamma subunit